MAGNEMYFIIQGEAEVRLSSIFIYPIPKEEEELQKRPGEDGPDNITAPLSQKQIDQILAKLPSNVNTNSNNPSLR